MVVRVLLLVKLVPKEPSVSQGREASGLDLTLPTFPGTEYDMSCQSGRSWIHPLAVLAFIRLP